MVCPFQGHIKSSSFRESDHMHKIKLGTFILSFPLLSAPYNHHLPVLFSFHLIS